MQINMDENGRYFVNIKSDRLHPTEIVRVEGPTEGSIITALDLLEHSNKFVTEIIETTGITVIASYYRISCESIQRERERLFEKARHDETQALYHARNEGKAEGKIEIAKVMIADGEPIDKIVRYTGLTEKEIRALD